MRIIPQILFFGNSPLPIQVRDGELENGREGDPEEIRYVGERDPFEVRIHGDERPDERAEDEEDVYRGEGVIFQPKLQIRIGEVEDEVEGERQGDDPRQGLGDKRLIEHLAERNGHDRVEDGPHRAEHPRRRRPTRLHERLVRSVGVHE